MWRPSEGMAADFVKGGTAAAPMARLKLLLQNQAEMIKRGSLRCPYTWISDCFLRILRQEGPLSLWRGNYANVLCYFPTQAFNFAFKDYLRNMFGCSKEKDGYVKWNVASGSAAGATTSLFLYHLDYAHTRLATDALECKVNGRRQFGGLLDVYKKTLRSDGLAVLYCGFGVSIIGITLYRGLYFGIYDSLKPIVLVGPLEGNFHASFALGWSVTTMSAVYAYPFDTVYRRMMLTSGEPSKYENAMHAFHQIILHEGFQTLFGGVTANMLLGTAGAGFLAGYDLLHQIAYKYGYGLEPWMRSLT